VVSTFALILLNLIRGHTYVQLLILLPPKDQYEASCTSMALVTTVDTSVELIVVLIIPKRG